MKQFISPLGSN